MSNLILLINKKFILKSLKAFFVVSYIFLNLGCSSNYQLSMTDPNADMNSSLDELKNKGGDKSKIVAVLGSKIGNMELFRVIDFTKKYLMPDDYGYGIFYDLKKEDEKGSGNIYLYKRDNYNILNGISSEAIDELKTEQQILEKKEIPEFKPSIEEINGIKFYKSIFVTPPDSNNDKYECFLYITGYNKNYIKIIFFYPEDSDNSDKETELFIESLVTKLKNINKE